MVSDETLSNQFAALGAENALRHVPSVHVRTANGESRTVVLDRELLVGSAVEEPLRLADASASRLHARLVPKADGLWVEDLNSKNGTYVDGIRIGVARIPDGGSIRVGDTELSVSYASESTRVDAWPRSEFHEMAGSSLRMREVFALLAKYARTDATVLIEGETGTGKELAAKAIHAASTRKSKPFVTVDCGALPEQLLEGELFGHMKGSFTSAFDTRAGAIEEADGGTVFLDEIGELPLQLQPKLLRALEAREVRRLGATQYRQVNVRFVAATHRDLRKLASQGVFREDLLFRLAVLPVTLPPLRERLGDIPALVQRLLPSEELKQVTPQQMYELMRRPWLGNVRELRNYLERVVAVGHRTAAKLERSNRVPWAPRLDDELLALPLAAMAERVKDACYREYLLCLMNRNDWNVKRAADEAMIQRGSLYRLLDQYEIVRPGSESNGEESPDSRTT